ARRGGGPAAARPERAGCRRAANRAPHPALCVQGAPADARARRRRRPDVVERKARRARVEGNVPVTADTPGTFPALLRRNRDLYGAKSALVTEDRAITHSELDGESRMVAARFVAGGAGKSARIGVLLPNGIEFAVVAAAAWR